MTDQLTIHHLRTPGLGDSTYVVIRGDAALLVDPQRDFERFLEPIEEAGAKLAVVADTHLHNDYVSGAPAVAARTGASLVLPAASGAAYRHVPAFHLEDIETDAFTIRPIHTPGHTPEHTAYLVLVDGFPMALFSGGSLLVGSAGRPDLLGLDRADTLARLQFRSVNRLAGLGDDIGLYPTHGEGSFCTASGAGKHTSTIGEERLTNPVLAYPNEDAFVAGQLSVLQPYPTYYAHMGPANVSGPAPLPDRDLSSLTPGEVRRLQDRGVLVVDARPRYDFADGHVPNSLGIELRDDFGTWVGWLTEFDAEIVLVLNDDQDRQEALVQLNRIGYDRVLGVMNGIGDWLLEGHPVDHIATVGAEDVVVALRSGGQVIDVRSPAEWDAGHLEGTHHIYLPDLAEKAAQTLDPAEPTWLVCATGYRAMAGAGFLRDHGFPVRVYADGGVDDLLKLGEETEGAR